MFRHTPVLLDEVMEFLDPRPGGRFIDGTLGAGGHTRAILDRTAPDGRMLVLDQDESALALARETLQSFGSRVEFVHSNFREVATVAAEYGFHGLRRRSGGYRHFIHDGGRSVAGIFLYA